MVSLICMVGNDFQRIIDGVFYWNKVKPIETIYLLFDKKKDKYGVASQKNVRDLKNIFSFTSSKPTVKEYNPQVYQNVFCTLYKILRTEVEVRKRTVLIDSTSTTKEAYGATVTVALMFENVRIYIVPPQERGWYIPSSDDMFFIEWFNKTRSIRGMMPQEIYLPGERFERPRQEEKHVLLRLNKYGGYSETLTSLIKWCNHNPRDPVTKNRYSRIIKRLENKGFVKKRNSRKGKSVTLTHFGKILAEAMK